MPVGAEFVRHPLLVVATVAIEVALWRAPGFDCPVVVAATLVDAAFAGCYLWVAEARAIAVELRVDPPPVAVVWDMKVAVMAILVAATFRLWFLREVVEGAIEADLLADL